MDEQNNNVPQDDQEVTAAPEGAEGADESSDEAPAAPAGDEEEAA